MPAPVRPPPEMPNRAAEFRYFRPIAFGLAASAGIYVTAAVVYDNESQKSWLRLQYIRDRFRRWSFRGGQVDEEGLMAALWREKRDMLDEKSRLFMRKVRRTLDKLELPPALDDAITMLADKYAGFSEADKTMAALIAINLAVFSLWQIPAMAPFMTRWFTHHPGSGRSITLLTSCFSHASFFHLGFNMLGLWSFGPLVYDELGREQFLAMYLGTGIGANIISHIGNLRLHPRRMLAPSLGASGALYGLLTATAIIHPHAQVAIAFLPFIPITISTAVGGLMTMDALGIICGWRAFDHFAHLAGAGIGLGYLTFGEQYMWQPLVRKIREIRSKRRGGGGGGSGEPQLPLEMQARSRFPWWFRGNPSKE
ncbi:uncharacterized protein BYT42DRAFT_550216 [Radiomyces spectabilis]|uniref:uncharacterized protein n=1 Tax=Radiomyces spectabilis TaxID=64574 RepID=UPI00221E5D1C|nr:uncharacterized protein BYT42DRAFT_550216 [Radiomyces spectabilis]KAI8365354.1 hypothetical protein BYT42DRAFT_550216 [Radiomyces spectabilis]